MEVALKALYRPSARQIAEVDVPTFGFLMVDGEGNPNTSTHYQEATQALYAVSYVIKFALRRETSRDYAVMPLEGLWWADDLSRFGRGEQDDWNGP